MAEKLTDAEKELIKNMRSANAVMDELSSTTSALSDAIKKYANSLDTSVKEVKQAEAELKDQKVQSRRVKESLGVYSQTLYGIITAGKQELAVSKKKTQVVETQLKQAQQALVLAENELTALRRRKGFVEQSIVRMQAENAALDAKINSTKESIRYSQQSIVAAQQDKAATQERINKLKQSNSVIESEMQQTQKSLSTIFEKERLGIALSDEEHAEKAKLLQRLKTQDSAIKANNNALTRENLQLIDLAGTIGRLTADMQSEEEVLQGLTDEQKSLVKKIKDKQVTAENMTQEELKLLSEIGGLTEAIQDRTDKVKSAKEQELNVQIDTYQKALSMSAGMLRKVSDALGKLVEEIYKTQKQFGVSAGTAAKLEFGALVQSVKSYANSLLTLGKAIPLSREEIKGAQEAFQAEFGGVLTSDAARGLAEQAKRMGVGADQLAVARRAFMTQTMGDTGKAKAAQDKFVSEFAKKGLTSKEAMAAIGQNSELLARNGTRFATSFARAAADAKKIGVDLSKVDQIGDNIIGDFEGFLEKTSELGAMGFNFDTSRMAEIAESGDTGALMEELRSQLAAQGKDLTNLRRSEQLALSQAFGIPMAELQRLAAPKKGEAESAAGEKTLKPEELQQDANKHLSQLVQMAKVSAVVLGGIAATLAVIATGKGMALIKDVLMKKFPGSTAFSPLTDVFKKFNLGNVASRIPGTGALGRGLSTVGRIGSAPARLLTRIPGVSGLASGAGGALSRIGPGGILAGLTGAISGFRTAKAEGKDTATAAGAGAVQGGFAAAGAALGTLIPIPVVGTIIGGWLGNTFGKGINKYFPDLSAGIGIGFKKLGESFEPVKKSFASIGQSLKPLGEAFSRLFTIFDGPGKDAGKTAMSIGTVIGYLMKIGFLPLNLILQAVAGTIRTVVDIFTVVFNIMNVFGQLMKGLFTGDFSGFTSGLGTLWESVKSLFSGLITGFGDMIGTFVRTVFGETIYGAIRDFVVKIIEWVKNIGSRLWEGTKEKAAGAWQGVKSFFTGDDVVSRSGYGERTLVTPNGAVALNNQDNVVAYADDFVSDMMGGMRLFPKGALNPDKNAPAAASIDISKLERKLDNVVQAIAGMKVELDGVKVGRILASSTSTANQVGVLSRSS